jgi:hypothetical protein
MMTKWADYGISAVRFNPRHTHIDQVQVTPDQGESFGASSTEQRDNVVSAIKRGVTFITIFRGSDNNWKKGQPVFIDRINGIDFLKTVPNGKPIDNLDNLPEF